MGNLCPAIPLLLEKEQAMACSKITKRRSISPSTTWSQSTGTGGRDQPERLVAFNRNAWSQWTGLGIQYFNMK
jgi:hypothetical protein